MLCFISAETFVLALCEQHLLYIIVEFDLRVTFPITYLTPITKLQCVDSINVSKFVSTIINFQYILYFITFHRILRVSQ